jgi:hypothetical protein
MPNFSGIAAMPRSRHRFLPLNSRTASVRLWNSAFSINASHTSSKLQYFKAWP